MGQRGALLAATIVMTLGSLPAAALAGSDVTLLVSRADGAGGAPGGGYAPTISGDGRLVAFASSATSFDADDTDNGQDVYVRDLQAGTIDLVSRATGGARANGQSLIGAISGDGRFVAFLSGATNLDPADTDVTNDVYLRALQTGTTTLVSRGSGAGSPPAGAIYPAISQDGQRVAFATPTSLDDADTNGVRDVYVRDVQTNTTTLVSRATGTAGAVGAAESIDPAISADGRFVAFSTTSANLDPADVAGDYDVYVRELATGATRLVSRAEGAAGVKANGGSVEPSISADGSTVAFASTASNLNPGDNDSQFDVYARDMRHDLVTLVSRPAGIVGQKPALTASEDPTISSDGRLVAFRSAGAGLDPVDPRPLLLGDPGSDVYLRDLQTHTTTLVSRASGIAGAKGNADSLFPWLSGDGRFVTWESTATNLHPDDTMASYDIFARDPSPTPIPADPAPPPPAPPPGPPPPRPQPGCALAGNVVVGTDGPDTRDGTAATDIIFGLGADDVLRGRGGADCLYGGAGNDRLGGNAGDDRLDGDGGRDVLAGDAGADHLDGGAGRDQLDGGAGADRLEGGAVDDVLTGGAGNDRLSGGNGADRLRDDSGRDSFAGGAGTDRIDARDATRVGRAVPDRVSCGAGRRDAALVDRRDRVARDCELVRRR